MSLPPGDGGRAISQRDLLRDFCLVNAALSEQYSRLLADGGVSYPILGELIGRGMLKGVFWRLKDTAHQLFRRQTAARDECEPHARPYDTRMAGLLPRPDIEAVLDWSIGYAFHECVRLKESAYQNLHYTAKLERMRRCMDPHLLDPLIPLEEETVRILLRQLERTLHTLSHARDLLISYLGAHDENPYIARFLLDNEELADKTFGERLGDLLRALYKDKPQRRHLLAARAYLEGGRPDKASAALAAARGVSPDEEEELRLEIHNWNNTLKL